MISGLSAFPITPFRSDGHVDEAAFVRILDMLAVSEVDSVTVLGSTGSYMYLDRAERARVIELATSRLGNVPVFAGIGAIRTEHVLEHAADAEAAGVAGLLVPPVTYQALTPDDVVGLYEDVTAEVSTPVIVYDNPGTTHVSFTDDMYAAISRLPHVVSIKIPGVPADPAEAVDRVAAIRARIPAEVSIGVSGDAFGAAGLLAGCDAWYSVLAGTVPAPLLAITRAVQSEETALALEGSARLRPIWDLNAKHGSLRVTAVIAEILGLAPENCLPRPIRGLRGEDRRVIEHTVHDLALDAEV